MANDMRICLVDGTQYKYCSHCNGVQSKERWRYLYCSENCKDIHSVYNKYIANMITKEEAKSEYEKLDLSKRDSFDALIKEQIKDVLSSNAIEVKSAPTEENRFNKKKKKHNNYVSETIVNNILENVNENETVIQEEIQDVPVVVEETIVEPTVEGVVPEIVTE